ncbi:rna-directed dna polymerase from mobile element jockey-like [Pitangus sulphuratus]|nr:rna-directed dna polymerase from mobile element jockey-like [Pitangus sulphuratus]
MLKVRNETKVLDFRKADFISWRDSMGNFHGKQKSHGLDDRKKCSLKTLADDTEVDTLEWRVTLQEELDRLAEWANKNLIKFNKDKCKILHLGQHNPGLQHSLGSSQLGSSSVEAGLGVLKNHKLNIREQGAASAKKDNRILSCINKDVTSRDEEAIILFRSVLVRPHLEYCLQFWSRCTKKM